MKRQHFIREIIKAGCYLKRHGSRHDIYVNSKTGQSASITRHNELKDSLCKTIKKQLNLND